jgi:hypothetical protein
MYTFKYLINRDDKLCLIFNKDDIEYAHYFDTIDDLMSFPDLSMILDPEDIRIPAEDIINRIQQED